MLLKRFKQETKLIWDALPDLHLSWRIFFFTIPLSIFTLSYNTNLKIDSYSDFLGICLLAFSGHAAMVPLMIYGRRKMSNRKRVYIAISMGIVRGAVITFFEQYLAIDDLSHLIYRVIGSAILILYWFQIGSIFIQFSVIFRNDVRKLVEESILKRSTIELPKRDVNNAILLARIKGLQTEIEATLGEKPTREILNRRVAEIDKLVKDQIRPLSHSEWREGELVWVRAGIRKIFSTTLSRSPLPLWGILALMLPGIIMVQIPKYGLIDSIATHLAWIPLLAIARRFSTRIIPPKDDNYLRQNLFFMLLVVLAVAPIKALVAFNLAGTDLSTAELFRTQFFSAFQLLIFCSVTPLCLSLIEDGRSVFRQISSQLKEKDLEGFIELGVQSNAEAKYAQYLHAEVQSQLLGCKLLLMKSAEGAIEDLSPAVLQEVKDRLQAIGQPYVRPVAIVPTVRVQELARSWDGLATITHKLSAEVDGDDVPHEVISQLIEEAVVNSIKHGRAKKIHIQASPSAGAIKVEIHDDGTLEEGPKGSGLGSILFDTFTDGWSLGRSENKTVLKFSMLKTQESK